MRRLSLCRRGMPQSGHEAAEANAAATWCSTTVSCTAASRSLASCSCRPTVSGASASLVRVNASRTTVVWVSSSACSTTCTVTFMPLWSRSRRVLPGPGSGPPVETVHAEQREQAGEFVAVLAKPWDVLVVQEHAQDLGRPDGRGQDVMGLGVFEEGMYPAAVLRRTGTTATGTDRTVLAFLGGEVGPDLLEPQVKAPAGGEVVVVGESFGAPQAKIAQPNPPRIITEAGTTDIPDAVLATLDDEPVQVRTRPAEGDLQHRVQDQRSSCRRGSAAAARSTD